MRYIWRPSSSTFKPAPDIVVQYLRFTLDGDGGPNGIKTIMKTFKMIILIKIITEG